LYQKACQLQDELLTMHSRRLSLTPRQSGTPSDGFPILDGFTLVQRYLVFIGIPKTRKGEIKRF